MRTHKEVMQQALDALAAIQEVYGSELGPGTHQMIEENITALRAEISECQRERDAVRELLTKVVGYNDTDNMGAARINYFANLQKQIEELRAALAEHVIRSEEGTKDVSPVDEPVAGFPDDEELNRFAVEEEFLLFCSGEARS